MAVYITGDKHGRLKPVKQFAKREGLTSEDVIVILGDAGFNYYNNEQDVWAKNVVAGIEPTVLCIHGNHEMRPQSLPRLYHEALWHGGAVFVEGEFPSIMFAKGCADFKLTLESKSQILYTFCEFDRREMNDRGIKSAIRARIESLPDDSVFSATDFADIASSDNIRRAFKELCDQGAIDRAARGVYYKPRYSAALDQAVPPSVEKVAEAVARARGWTIAPSGDHALNILGLDTQVPAVYAYISTGPYANLQVGPFKVSFKHSANKNLVGMSKITLLVIQALKALGQAGVDDKAINHLSRRLDDSDKSALLEETQHSTAWIRQAVRTIAEGGSR